MKPGIYEGIPNEQYHSGPGVSSSGLKMIHGSSPLHYYAAKVAANENDAARKTSPILELGTAFHALMLEPHEFVKQYTLGLRKSDYPSAIDSREELVAMVEELNKGRLPKLSTSGTKDEMLARIAAALTNTEDIKHFQDKKGAELKAFIEELNTAREGLLSTSGTIPQLVALLRSQGMRLQLWDEVKAEWLANNGHRTVLDPETWDQLHSMRAAVLAHPAASKIMALKGRAERSVYWVDKETGVLCRCRPDWWPGDIVGDLKTTDDASPEAFARSIAKYGYDIQDAFYTDGLAAAGRPITAFPFVVVERGARVVNGEALGVAVYVLDAASRDLGRAKYRAALKTYAECERTGYWPCYGTKVQTISLPSWNFAQNAHLVEQTA